MVAGAFPAGEAGGGDSDWGKPLGWPRPAMPTTTLKGAVILFGDVDIHLLLCFPSLPLSSGRLRQQVERLRLAWNFGGAVKSCLADRCYAESCLVGRCYARQISRSLPIWMDERRTVAPLGTVVASTDDWTGKDDADLFPEDGSVVRG
ncbi:Arginyl-tRNA synthetase [Hordeum vulgare]|nr:Arginyl-tRNA synthetase [Hordeum vulgare]